LGRSDLSVDRVESPFDYAELGLLYCPVHLPTPNDPAYGPASREEIRRLVEAAGGRSLCLFTSYRAMEAAAEYLIDRLTDMNVLVQGSESKSELLRDFATTDHSVLLATMSFWQGVDIPGDDLTLVTIDRLPFPRPDEPVLSARRERLGNRAFRMIDLPRASTLLAQAAGRLVRRADDHGVVAVLDKRLATNRSYRWDLIGALPPFTRTKEPEEVYRFLRSLDTPR
jgi:ATP-dependent DNA helicase DinG